MSCIIFLLSDADFCAFLYAPTYQYKTILVDFETPVEKDN